MAAVTVLIAAERLAPAGERVARGIGVIVVGFGLFLIAKGYRHGLGGVGPHRHNSDCAFAHTALHSAGFLGPERRPYGAAVNDQKASGDEPAVSSPDLTVAMALGSKAQLPFHIVGIGASAGGLQALEEFFDRVARTAAWPTSSSSICRPITPACSARILSRRAQHPGEGNHGRHGGRAEPRLRHRAGPYAHATRRHLRLGEPVEKRGHRRPVDDFFRSLAAEQKEKAIAVILSGTGTNGTAGAQAIKAAGGICIAQNPSRASFPGMPRSLIDAGYADQIQGGPRDIPDMLTALCASSISRQWRRRAGRRRCAAARSCTHARDPRHPAHAHPTRLQRLRKATLLRRIHRRMGLVGIANLGDYARSLRSSADEVERSPTTS